MSGADPGNVRPSARATALARASARTMRPMFERLPLRPFTIRISRRLFDAVGYPAPPGTRQRLERIGGVPVRWAAARGADADAGVLLHLHGGGYVVGSSRSHRGLAARIGAAAGVPTVVVDYRLAPEHRFPAAFDDALAVYRGLLETRPAAEIVVVGDSSGGHLAAALIASLSGAGLPMPAARVLYSPVVAWSCWGIEAADRDSPDPVLPPRIPKIVRGLYLSEGMPDGDTRVEVLAADKAGWPPTLIQVGGTEALAPDAELLARSIGPACTFENWPGQIHVFQALSPLIPEARRALELTGRFIRRSLDGSGSRA